MAPTSRAVRWLSLSACLLLVLAATAAAAPGAQGIHLRVLDQAGDAAAYAQVSAHDAASGAPAWSGSTDAAGRAEVAVADGTYTLVVSSESDHFVVVREGAAAPGTLTLDTAGSVPVDAVARGPGGQTPSRVSFSFERFPDDANMAGGGDPDGRLRVDLSPATYCASATSWLDRLYLTRRELVVAGAAAVAFDVAQLGTGQVALRQTGAGEMSLIPDPAPACRGWAPLFDLSGGEAATLSAGRYDLRLDRTLRDASANRWQYHYRAENPVRDIASGSMTTLWLGGHHTVTLTPSRPAYPAGATATLAYLILDGYGNQLVQINAGPSQTRIDPHVVVRGPGGGVAYEGECRSPAGAGCSFALAPGEANGRYEVSWALDTGPLEGTLAASAEFTVDDSLAHWIYLPVLRRPGLPSRAGR